MKKKLLDFNARTLIGIAMGFALFCVLFTYAKIPTGIQTTDFHFAFGVAGFFAALFGPIAGFLIGFLGHTLSDIVQYNLVYWVWAVNSGIFGLIVGLVYPRLRIEQGVLRAKDLLLYNLAQIIANLISWLAIAPTADIMLYGDAPALVFRQGAVAAGSNILSAGIIGSVLLFLYARAHTPKTE